MIAYIVIIAQTIAVMVCIATKAIVIITRMKTIGGVVQMAENKWIIDGHHYTCPACKKTMAIVVNESDEDFDFCPFCGKRMLGQMAEKFELGKFYKHTTGEKLYICGVVNTNAYGKSLVGEDGYGNLIPVGNHEYATENYHEITKEEFLDGRE